MTAKQILLEQFTACFDRNAWFVSVRNALDGLTVDQAVWKPRDDVNCIWETLSHLAYYNKAYLQRFKGIDYEYDVDNNDQTFSTGEYSEEEWRADVLRFDAVMNEFRDLIAKANEGKFSEAVSNTNKASWAELISDINAHNAYHAGQILLVRKLQGSWNPANGVS